MAEPTDSPMTMTCRLCDRMVPAGAFCGLCGADAATQRGGPTMLRLNTFAPAPTERVFSLLTASALFPRLSRESRQVYRIALVLYVLALVGSALVGWQGPLAALATLGPPLLFIGYLVESDAFQDLKVRVLAFAFVSGAALGAGWALWIAKVFTLSHHPVFSTGPTTASAALQAMLVPTISTLGMLAPVAATKLWQRQRGESLDGFAIGTLTAWCFLGAASLIDLFPQLIGNSITNGAPVRYLIGEAGIRGVAVPIITMATGGMFGIALVSRVRRDAVSHRRQLDRRRMLTLVGLAIAVRAALGAVEVAPLSSITQLGVYIIGAAVALQSLRLVEQAALLNEPGEPDNRRDPVLCPQCCYVVPDMPFCARCGASAQAASRTSRSFRRRHRPIPIDHAGIST